MRVNLLKLNKQQLNRFSEFLANVGIVFFTSMVIPIFSDKEAKIFMVLTGLILASSFLFISLLILKT